MIFNVSGFTSQSEKLIERLAGSGHYVPKSKSRVQLPFEDAFGGFRDLIRESLQSKCCRIPQALIESFENSIVQHLIEVSSKTLLTEFDKHRPLGAVFAARLFGTEEPPACGLYDKFVAYLMDGGWASLLSSQPVLMRLLALVISEEVAAAAEFCFRLQSDRAQIAARFNINIDSISEIQPHVSDPHQGRRSVLVATFESGNKLVYKPHGLALEYAWNEFVTWFNQRSRYDLLAPAVLDCGTHGWVEHVRHEPCSTKEAAHRYHRRAGCLLSVLYALRSSDCHFENIIAHGEYPVLIDTETLLQPEFSMGDGNDHRRANMHSVLTCGLLPTWEHVSAGQAFNSGALGHVGSDVILKPGWRFVNTDIMCFGDQVATEVPNFSRETQKLIDLKQQQEDVTTGFVDGYTTLHAHRCELLSQTSPLRCFQDTQVRIVLRNTRLYKTLIDHATQPEYLGSEKAFRQAFHESLEKLGAAGGVTPALIVDLEVGQLSNLDIPLFSVPAEPLGSTEGEGVELEYSFSCCALENAQRGIENLTERDLCRQIRLIGLSFAASDKRSEVREEGISLGYTETLPATAFLDEACRIGDILLDTAIENSDGLYWAALQKVPETDRYVVAPIDAGLWAGTAGVALFLAALYRETRDDRYRSAAISGLKATLSWASRDIGIGAGCGLGSIIYSLATAGEWLSAHDLFDSALSLAEMINSSAIVADSTFDVFSGAAGAILGLLKLYALVPIDSLLLRVRKCSEHLVVKQLKQNAGGAAWPGRAAKPATGFAHGTAGIAYALFRTYAYFPEHAFLAAALSAIKYENALYLQKERNWLDVRSIGRPDWQKCTKSWCHGSTGIGLSRAGMLNLFKNKHLRKDLAIAIRSVSEENGPSLDQLCCGKMGSVDLLLMAGVYLRREDLLDRARRRGSGILKRAQAAGGYRLSSSEPDMTGSPGLFTGLAGMGYEFLRLANTRLPSVLLFE